MTTDFADYSIRCAYKSRCIKEHSTLEVMRTDNIQDVIGLAMVYADQLASRYNCRMRQWGKTSWRIWEPGEDGWDIWLRITKEASQERGLNVGQI